MLPLFYSVFIALPAVNFGTFPALISIVSSVLVFLSFLVALLRHIFLLFPHYQPGDTTSPVGIMKGLGRDY